MTKEKYNNIKSVHEIIQDAHSNANNFINDKGLTVEVIELDVDAQFALIDPNKGELVAFITHDEDESFAFTTNYMNQQVTGYISKNIHAHISFEELISSLGAIHVNGVELYVEEIQELMKTDFNESTEQIDNYAYTLQHLLTNQFVLLLAFNGLINRKK